MIDVHTVKRGGYQRGTVHASTLPQETRPPAGGLCCFYLYCFYLQKRLLEADVTFVLEAESVHFLAVGKQFYVVTRLGIGVGIDPRYQALIASY